YTVPSNTSRLARSGLGQLSAEKLRENLSHIADPKSGTTSLLMLFHPWEDDVLWKVERFSKRRQVVAESRAKAVAAFVKYAQKSCKPIHLKCFVPLILCFLHNSNRYQSVFESIGVDPQTEPIMRSPPDTWTKVEMRFQECK